MYSFMNDYSEGAHVKVLELLINSNLEQNVGYGEDKHSDKAKLYIKKLLKDNNVDIHFIPGGTQTNLLVISSLLRPHECVIGVDTSHINVHETGAIEATGHKVVTVKGVDGKLTPKSIEEVVKYHSDEHMVKPKMVYISNSTELGTVYTKEELYAIHKVCKKLGLILFMDGARLGSALMSRYNDLELKDIKELVDVFYIGGTKNGALLGEALVIVNDKYKEDFRYLIKQKGALMAKGFVAGIQFEALFENNLFFELADHANKMAEMIEKELISSGYEFYVKPSSNQLFPIIPDSLLEKLSEEFSYSVQFKYNETSSVIRFVTSFATTPKAVNALCEFIRNHPLD